MRSYIFTATERKAIQLLLEGKIKASARSVTYIRSRVKTFVDLARDVDLYLKLRALAETEATIPA